jgi:hypothetical protein
MGLWVMKFLCETKIDNVDLISMLTNTHEEVVWFDILVDKVTERDVFNMRDLR